MCRLGHVGILDLSRLAYSSACAGECIEHGPTMTMILSSFPARILAAVNRAVAMVACDSGEDWISWRSNAGCTRGSYCEIDRGSDQGSERTWQKAVKLYW